MDTSIRASLRQFAALWYAMAIRGGARPDSARETAIMQAELYLSDFGIGENEAAEYLEAADQALNQMYHPDANQN